MGTQNASLFGQRIGRRSMGGKWRRFGQKSIGRTDKQAFVDGWHIISQTRESWKNEKLGGGERWQTDFVVQVSLAFRPPPPHNGNAFPDDIASLPERCEHIYSVREGHSPIWHFANIGMASLPTRPFIHSPIVLLSLLNGSITIHFHWVCIL